jgi:MoaA/NifB/PqqE/SkfB family radical SAM enzyme
MLNIKKYYSNIWVIRNHISLLRILKGCFRHFVLHKSTLKTIELYPTFNCQLKCTMCSMAKYKTDKIVLGLDDYKMIAQAGAAMGAWVVTFLGGEPFLYPQLEEVISIFNKKHFFTHIVSNGLAITKEKLIVLKNAGLKCVYISLESMSPETNDNIRGKGSFIKAMESLKLCKEAGLVTGISTTIFPNKMEEAERVIKYCHEMGINASGGQIAPVGNAEGTKTLTGQEFKLVRDLLKKYPRLTYDWALSYSFKQNCPAGKEKIGITCHGDVIGCSYNPISFGNILEEPLSKIWSRMGKFTQFSKDYPGCLSAEDAHYITKYLNPIYNKNSNPTSYKEHPAILESEEHQMFSE